MRGFALLGAWVRAPRHAGRGRGWVEGFQVQCRRCGKKSGVAYYADDLRPWERKHRCAGRGR